MQAILEVMRGIGPDSSKIIKGKTLIDPPIHLSFHGREMEQILHCNAIIEQTYA